MIYELRFALGDYIYLTVGRNAFHLSDQTAAAAKNIYSKDRLWKKVLEGNTHPSATNRMHIIASASPPTHIDWATVEYTTEGLNTLLTTLWQETHPMVADKLSLVNHNDWERRDIMEWVAMYVIMTMHYIFHLYVDLNTWYINVEVEAGYIYLPRIAEIYFELDHPKFNDPHMSATFSCTPLDPAPSQPITCSAPAPALVLSSA